MSENTPQRKPLTFADEADEVLEPDFKPLTPEEASRWRESHPPLSPWRIVGWQLLAGSLAAGLAWVLSGRAEVAWSTGYGALAVCLPAALMARGLSRRSGVAGAALAGFFVWELVKVVLTVALLLAAPKLVPHLSWLALLAGFVVAMKVYWVAMWLHPSHPKPTVKI